MKRMITFSEAKSILALDSISPYNNNRDIWKSQAITYGAVLNSPYSESSWALNRLLPVDVAMKQMYKITFNPNNGGQDAPYTIRVAAGVTPSPTTPTYSGYNFAGWFPTLAPASADTTYTAQWTPIIPTYTITYLDYDEYSTYQTFANVLQGSSIPRPSTTPAKPDFDGKVFSFTEWVLNDGTNRRLDKDIKTVTGNLTFKPIYNGEDINDGNVKIFDNIGRVKNYTKNTPVNLDKFWPETQNGWWSLPHDGHGSDSGYPDICGQDGGISPLGLETGRYRVPNTNFYHYVDDSVVYEGFTFSNSNNFPTNSSSVTSSDLCTELILLDLNGNEKIHIKSLSPWIKFAPIDIRINKTILNPEGEPNPSPITLVDLSDTTKTVTKTIPISVMIAYYIEDNAGNDAREGKVHVTTAGGACSYVTEWAPGNQYMTDGNVYFYQLGRTYIPVS